MKIQGRCRNCERDFPVELLVNETDGHCPFCGIAMDPNYVSSLTGALASAQAAGSALVAALDKARSYGANLEIDPASVVEPVRRAAGTP